MKRLMNNHFIIPEVGHFNFPVLGHYHFRATGILKNFLNIFKKNLIKKLYQYTYHK